MKFDTVSRMSSRPRQPARGVKSSNAKDQSTDKQSAPLSRKTSPSGVENHDRQTDEMLLQATEAQDPKILKPQNEGATNVPPASLPHTNSRERLTSVLPRNGSTLSALQTYSSEVSNRSRLIKFQPKSKLRRSQAQREEMERAEAERQATRQFSDTSINNKEISYGHRGGRGGSDGKQQFTRRREGRESFASGVLGGDIVKEHVPRQGRSRGGSHPQGSERDMTIQGVESEGIKTASTRVKKEDGVKADAEKSKEDVTKKPMTRKRKATKAKTNFKKEEEEFEYVSDEAQWDDDLEPKINIEHINLISDDETEETGAVLSETAKGKQRERSSKLLSWQLRPVRLERQEHVERQIGINTDASSLTSAELRRRAKERQAASGSLFLPERDVAEIISASTAKAKRKPRDVEFVRNERRWKGVYEDGDQGDEVLIKKELSDHQHIASIDGTAITNGHGDVMDLDKQQASADADALTVDERLPSTDPGDIKLQPEYREGARKKSSASPRLRRPKIRGYRDVNSIKDAEDNDEEDADLAEIMQIWREYQENNSTVEADLGDASVSRVQTGESPHSDLKSNPDRQNNVYLMQLPPILPSLRDSSKPPPTVKTEGKGKSKPPVQEIITNPFSTPIKPDPDPKDELTEGLQHMPIPNAYTAMSLFPPSGCPGTLTMYESGKIIADWGGISLDVKQSVPAGFAQEVLMYNYDAVQTKVEDDSRFEETVSVGDKAWAVGNIEGSFVASLDWETMFG